MDLSSLLAASRAFVQNAVPLIVQGIAMFVGLALIYMALQRIYRGQQPGTSEERSFTWGGVAAQLLIGGLVLRLGPTMSDMSQLLFGSDVQDIRGVMAYAPLPAQAGMWRQVLEVCLLWVVLLGWAGFFRGLLLWNKGVSGADSGNGGDYFWRGTWHLVGGAVAVNLTGAMQAFFGR